MRNFAILIVTVSLATYIIVFNLNQLTYGLGILYNQVHQPLVNHMSLEGGLRWAKHVERFTSFQLAKNRPAPSEWLLVWHGLKNCDRPVRNSWRKVARVWSELVAKIIGRRNDPPLAANP